MRPKSCSKAAMNMTKYLSAAACKEMSQILETIAAFPKKIKVVISAVTIETIAETNELLGKYAPDFDVIQATSDEEEKSAAIISWIRIIQ